MGGVLTFSKASTRILTFSLLKYLKYREKRERKREKEREREREREREKKEESRQGGDKHRDMQELREQENE